MISPIEDLFNICPFPCLNLRLSLRLQLWGQCLLVAIYLWFAKTLEHCVDRWQFLLRIFCCYIFFFWYALRVCSIIKWIESALGGGRIVATMGTACPALRCEPTAAFWFLFSILWLFLLLFVSFATCFAFLTHFWRSHLNLNFGFSFNYHYIFQLVHLAYA